MDVPIGSSVSWADVAVVAGLVVVWTLISDRVDRFGVTAPMLFVFVGLLISGDRGPRPAKPTAHSLLQEVEGRQPGGPWGAWPTVVVPPRTPGTKWRQPGSDTAFDGQPPLQRIKAPHPWLDRESEPRGHTAGLCVHPDAASPPTGIVATRRHCRVTVAAPALASGMAYAQPAGTSPIAYDLPPSHLGLGLVDVAAQRREMV